MYRTSETCRILAKDAYISNDTRATGNNNNDLIIGPSGAGKTRGYVIPNILQANESLVVADTKGNLCSRLQPYLEDNGYQVVSINFTDMAHSQWGYNPMAFIRYDSDTGSYSEQDIMSMSALVVPVKNQRDPYWEQSAQIYLQALMSYVLDCLPKGEHDLISVCQLSQYIGSNLLEQLFQELCEWSPDCFAVNRYRTIRNTCKAEKTDACIRSFLDNALLSLTFHEARALFQNRRQVNFNRLGTRKTAVFLTISDTDRSNDRLVNLFYSQALQHLVALADRSPDNHLPVPVRFILDDFATNTVIPDFDNIISVIRSRDISVSLVVQSLSQLEGLYGRARSQTIINNCDNWLYLGGLDLYTAQEMSIRLNRTVQTVLNLPHQQAVLLTRGQEPRRCSQFRPEEHPRYGDAMAHRQHQDDEKGDMSYEQSA